MKIPSEKEDKKEGNSPNLSKNTKSGYEVWKYVWIYVKYVWIYVNSSESYE